MNPSDVSGGRVDPTARFSPGFAEWLAETDTCLILTSYQSGRVFFCTLDSLGKVALQHLDFDRPMGISRSKGGFSFGGLHRLWRYTQLRQQKPDAGETVILAPASAHYTGFLNCHDIGVLEDGTALVASSLTNSVLSLSPGGTFTHLWSPGFIESLQFEDICHLNGLAADSKGLRYVSVLGTEALPGTWRRDASKGAIYDATSNLPVATDLWMPHSPRLNGDELYALESAKGSFGRVGDGKIEEQVFLPGFTRGLDFLGSMAAIGLSRIRPTSTMATPLSRRLAQSRTESSCGVILFDLKERVVRHSLIFDNGVDEIFDVAFVQGVKNPRLVHPDSSDALKTFAFTSPILVDQGRSK